MTDHSKRNVDRLATWARSPRGGALLAALLTLAVLLPLWILAIDWYRAELLGADPGKRSLLIFEAGGLIVMVLLAGLVYLLVNRQALLSQAVQERTREIAHNTQRLEEDLARRRRMEAELRASESRSQALLNAIPDMMFRVDRQGRFLDYHADENEMALPRDSVIGGSLRQLPAPEGVVECMLKNLGAVLDTNQIQTMEYSLYVAGSHKEYEARMVADGPDEVVAIVRDITERKRAEQSLHRWAHMFKHAEWGVAIGSADGCTLEMMNPAYARMHGYTVEELSGLPIASVFAPGTADELSALIRAANETGHAVMESTHVRKDGTTFPVMVDLTAVKDEHGQLLYRVANVQDITERKRAEDELRASEAQLRLLVEQMPALLWTVDTELRFASSSGAGLAALGLQPQDVVGRSLLDFGAPADAEFARILEMHQRALRGESVSYESLRRGRNVQNHVEPLRAANGDIVGCIGVGLDITGYKQSEAALRRSQQQYEQLVNSIDGIVWEGDAQTGLFTFVSPASERILGYPVENWLTEPAFWSDHLHPDDRKWVVDTCASATAALQPHECEYRMLAANGRSVWLRETVTVTAENHQPKLLRGMLIDITERKQVEEALREREEQYRNVFESSLDGMFINSLSGRLVDFNPAAAHMHGYTVDEFRQIQPSQFVHPDSQPLFAAYMETVRTGREYRCRALDVRKDGSTFYVEVVGTPFTLRGQPHAFAIVRDISVQVEAERLLEQRVAERTRELSTLLDVSRNVASTLEIEPLLGRILDGLKVFVDYSSARINTLEGQVLRVRAARGLPRTDRQVGAEFTLSGPVAKEVLISRRVLVIPDITSPDDQWAVAFRQAGSMDVDALPAHARSWMGVPLIARDRVIGSLSLEHRQSGFYDAHHAEVVLALADQVAVALENARLFTEAQGKAVLEERQRLARDLHDSVTQSLYSLTLLAEAARRLIDLDVPQAARYLGDMGEIAQQALKEMRLLVYQLRPLALEQEGLIGALQARLDSVEKRAGIDARFLIEGNLGCLTPAAEEGLFRIAQEALNNALKHAAARTVMVCLRGEEDCVTLEVTDDGCGSALLTTDAKGGLGLNSIKERVAQLKGALIIDSAPGAGTRIAVEVPRSARATA